MKYTVLGTGSTGNAVLLDDYLMIDCGLSYKSIAPFIRGVKLVLLTHVHSDHFKPSTVRAIHQLHPALRWGCAEWMAGPLLEAGVDRRVIDVYEPGKKYGYASLGLFVRPETLFHNVPNIGYHLTMKSGERAFYATDTGTLAGIEAKGYDWYFVEANHTEAEIAARIAEKRAAGEFIYEYKAAQNHLSREQAENWLYQQMGPKSQYVFLHQHQDKEYEREG